jgi:plasmid stabilization system protein ParE
MDRQIIWTPQAENTLTQIVEYLEQNWTEREIQKLFLRIDKTVSLIQQNPKVFRCISKKNNLHEALVTKQNVLIYKITNRDIFLISFWDTRRNPKKKKFK